MAEFRKLRVYSEAVTFAKEAYELTAYFPRDEKYGLSDQLRRAAVSIVLNIAEGSGGGSKIEFARFLKISLRSLYEVDACLELAVKFGYCEKKDIQILYQRRLKLGAMLAQLIKSLV